jgi:hypothetical protein
MIVGLPASGQVVGLLNDLPVVADLVEGIVAQANGDLGRLGSR